MILTQPKSRVVFFRVTHEEYETLQKLCISSGSRSISDLSRVAVTQYVSRCLHKRDPLQCEIQRLRTKIQHLAATIEEVSMLLKRSDPLQTAGDAGSDG